MMSIKLLGVAFVCVLATAAPSLGSNAPVFAQALAVGTMKPTTIHATAGAMVLDAITIKHGGTFGWHMHSAPAAVVVTGGTLTVFDPSIANCAPFKVSKGQSFVEPANHVHLARNEGSTPVTLYALYLGVPKGKMGNVEAQTPASCKA
jgi:quercetin dioxygenase-like cupin family protein